MKIHYCSFSNMKDILIYCKQEWTEYWGYIKDNARCYRANNGDYYTFDKEMVTCEDCLNKLASNHPKM